MSAISQQTVKTPIGRFTYLIDNDAVIASHWSDRGKMHDVFLAKYFPLSSIKVQSATPAIARQVAAYFEGDPQALNRIPIEPLGTPFQQRVWSQLLEIEPGTTVAYSDVAAAIDRPTSFRAVAQANRANPISVIVPCHRVIGKNGALTGYSGNTPSGLRRKAWLINLEKRA